MAKVLVIFLGIVDAGALIIDPVTGALVLVCSVVGVLLWQRRARRAAATATPN